MGLLVEGKWKDQWYDTKGAGGRFERPSSAYRDWVTADGSSGYPAEAGRYHLYVSLACPWAHRTLIARRLKGLEDAIPISVVHWYMGDQGWAFRDAPGCIPDPNLGADYLHRVYTAANPTYSGRVTVPVLWDTQRRTIVNNESAEILRMFNSAFNAFADSGVNLLPEPLRESIDELNRDIYKRVNNGVYRCGFATSQEAYDEAFADLFACLDALDRRLADQPFLLGDAHTEADWRLFTTLIRFDAVYVGHFKCNLRRIADYPNLSRYTLDLARVPKVASTIDFEHIKRHYYESHSTINPTGIVPGGPAQDAFQAVTAAVTATES